MILASWEPTTLIDFPGRVAATLFTVGCSFRCPFCHNPELVLPERAAFASRLDVDRVFAELDRRRGFLDGIVLTGGEPTSQDDLAPFIERLKGLDLSVKVDTNGSRPEVIEALLASGLVDYVAIDIKAPPARYAEFSGVDGSVASVERTVCALKSSDADYELRTTVAPGLSEADVNAIADWIGPASRYVLQRFRVPRGAGTGLLDPSWAERDALGDAALQRAWSSISDRFEAGGVR